MVGKAQLVSIAVFTSLIIPFHILIYRQNIQSLHRSQGLKIMGSFKRQFGYEYGTEDGKSPKRPGWERTSWTTSQFETAFDSPMNLGLTSPQHDVIPALQDRGHERVCYGTVTQLSQIQNAGDRG